MMTPRRISTAASRIAGRATIAASGVEQLDDRLRPPRELAKRGNDWPAGNYEISIERYLNGEINAVVRIGRHPRQYGAVFQVCPGVTKFGSVSLAPSVEANTSRLSPYRNELPVLSRNVHLVQGIEQIVPSLVWLEIFDRELVSARQPLYHFTSSVLPDVELLDTMANREPDIFWGDVAVSFGKSVGENIETATHAVDDRASFRIDNAGKRLPHFDLDKVLAGISIFLSDGAVWATRSPSVDLGSEDWELGYGPIDSGLSL